ncbi:UNVERIFIED_CONTAM: hypothetical protein PYX00_011124 [Menopon gallinae]|uniref:pyridoxal 5'-phosphate synthase n=1 Tax=Menopon gallinae TaxID=328185 RepID=A0AAW2H626_9NEOP
MNKTIVNFQEPFLKLKQWLIEAKKSYQQLKLENYNAATLSTVSLHNQPSSRIVLIKNIDEDGLVFYTNLNSKKAHEIANNNKVSILFYWEVLKKQIRIEGVATLLTKEESEVYFNSRPYLSKIGAWASKQSAEMQNISELKIRVVKYLLKHKLTVPKPDFWSGYRIKPIYFEFWEEGKFRLHNRKAYSKVTDGFEVKLIYP